ncbi:MAG: histidine phosphatase family protein [Candidatus Doudnabacteria bacterium]|nr:histidine phosphatase family protein [Candidatus Doudnabacteria bacterium]
MKLLMIRHGQTDGNKNEIVYGHLDLPINEVGEKQVAVMADQLTEHHIDAIYASPLMRTHQTAEVVSTKLKLPVVYRDELIERDFGSLNGRSWKDILEEFGPDYRHKDFRQEYDYHEFGGEDFNDVKKRVTTFLDFLRQTHTDDKVILAITHAGIIRLMYHLFSDVKERDLDNETIHEFIV